MNRLERRIASLRRGKGVIPYVTAGDGGLETTAEVLAALDLPGVASVELGVPFSDPIGDGPVLQAAADRALAAGTALEDVLGLVAGLRDGARSDLPIAIFSYANPLVRRGWEQACQMIADAGADGLVVPDLPVEEGEAMRVAAAAAGLCPVFFVAPTTTPERISAAAAASRGFLYAVGRLGVTGRQTEVERESVDFLERVAGLSNLPVAVGFGLRTADQVAAVLKHADLAIVGTAMVERIHAAAERGPTAAARAASEFVAELAAEVA